jgi:hypothetical protein
MDSVRLLNETADDSMRIPFPSSVFAVSLARFSSQVEEARKIPDD